LILTAGYESFQYVNLNNRLNTIASKVANWVSSDITMANIQDCFIGARLLGQADDFAKNGTVVVSGISASKSGANPVLAWQVKNSATSSIVVKRNDQSVTSAPFALAAQPQTIVVEVTYNYVPFFSSLSGVFPSITLYKTAQTVPQNTSQFNSF
ncbi:MAG: hypothetical protein WCK82_15500, partial [Bacteroidota bacterium]